ncbi:primase C-terminal domain-containing protein [Paracoccus liaowanqingii]|uniref:primase C-terminal domain-containing protein n=1 Tax=Paracoccus liaowanqingii TaxID=2560053 RepID=UPI00159BDAC3|nr:primase C-terminal domain-containing protein [Paracoccus liaowanqingii]
MHKLRPAANIPTFPKQKLEQSNAIQRVAPGSRNLVLWDYLRSQARFCDSLNDLLDVGRTFADERLDRTSQPFLDSEIVATAKSVWEWTQDRIAAGEYYVGTGQRLTLPFKAIDKVLPLGADAIALYLNLQRRSNHRGELIVANDMRLAMPDSEWTLVRFRKARATLIAAGIITETKAASTWAGPARYSWGG